MVNKALSRAAIRHVLDELREQGQVESLDIGRSTQRGDEAISSLRGRSGFASKTIDKLAHLCYPQDIIIELGRLSTHVIDVCGYIDI